MSILEFSNLKYTYNGGKSILRGVSGKLEQGKLYAILGSSGCGKTTLLSLLGGLDSPEDGQILFDGKNISETGLGDHRRKHISFIFQSYNLIDYLNTRRKCGFDLKIAAAPNFRATWTNQRRSKEECAEAIRRSAAASSHCPCLSK